MRDLVYELDGLAIGMAANSTARDTVSSAAREIERLQKVLNEIALRTSPYRERWDEWPLVSGIDQLVRDAGGNAYVGGQNRNES